MLCKSCPRKCGVDRERQLGYCNGGKDIGVAKIMTHMFEEPVISGGNGSGAIFFGGCNLRCVYCQNATISQVKCDTKFTPKELGDEMLRLQDGGVHNINLVTAAHYVELVAQALSSVKSRLNIPVIYNSSGYELVDAIKMLDGLIDVYLPDFKYLSPQLSETLSSAKDYAIVATAAIDEMIRQQPKVIIADGLIERGVVIRHLVLPGFKEDSLQIVQLIASKWQGILVSLMRQYTPNFNKSTVKSLSRRLTTYEYEIVLNRATELGLEGFCQDKGCEQTIFTPQFNK